MVLILFNNYKENPIAKSLLGSMSKYLLEVSDYCKEIGIGFSSTPYSKEEVDFLVEELNVQIKIASMDLNNSSYLRHIQRCANSAINWNGGDE